MANQPFFWGANGQKISSPQMAERQRKVADALLNRPAADSWQSGLANLTNGLAGMQQNTRADEAEAAGIERAGGLFGGIGSGSSVDDIATLLANPDSAWANDAQTGVASALLRNQLDQSDPYRQLQMQKLQQDIAQGGLGGDESFFGNAIGVRNADGTISYGQFGNKGGFNIPELPEGASFATPVTNLNTGTGFTQVGKFGDATGVVTPIDNEQAEYDKAFGQGAGKASIDRVNALSNTLATADNMLSTIDGVLNDPALDDATGMMAWTQLIPGTPAYNFGQKSLQLQGQAFLQAFNDLKGGGQITETEGQKATQAIGRLSTSQSPEDYRIALNELKGIINASKARATINAGRGVVPDASIGGGWTELEGGIRIRPMGQ